MTDEMKENDASRWLVVSLDLKGHNFVVEFIHDNEGDAKASAEQIAKQNDGVVYGVYQKTGTATLEHRVAWKGAAR